MAKVVSLQDNIDKLEWLLSLQYLANSNIMVQSMLPAIAVSKGTHSKNRGSMNACNCRGRLEFSDVHIGALQYQELVNQQKALRNVSFEKGKYAYSRGVYTSAVTFFKQALDEEGPFTAMGGDIKMWLALAYEVRHPTISNASVLMWQCIRTNSQFRKTLISNASQLYSACTAGQGLLNDVCMGLSDELLALLDPATAD